MSRELPDWPLGVPEILVNLTEIMLHLKLNSISLLQHVKWKNNLINTIQIMCKISTKYNTLGINIKIEK